MDKNCGIYKITSPTGKVYIGQSKSLQSRKRQYKCLLKKSKIQPRIYNSLVKHGWEAHQFDIIEYCDQEQLNCSERFWQDEFDVLGKNGMNCVLTECGAKRRVISESTRQKCRDNANIRGLGKMFIGKTHTEETKEILRQQRLGTTLEQETKDKISKTLLENGHMKGIPKTQEHRQSLSDSRKNSGVAKGGRNPAAKLVLNTDTGIYYDCAKDAAEAFGIKPRNLRRYLNPDNGRKNPTSLIYV